MVLGTKSSKIVEIPETKETHANGATAYAFKA